MAEDTKNFTAEEREAMQAAAKEAKTKRSRAKKTPEEQRAEGEDDLKEAIAKLSDDSDRKLATGLHELVSEVAPDLVPRTYYGMPAYAKDGKTICFFQPASKFKVRYSTFGFQPEARIDDGEFFPTSFAVLELTPAAEKRLVELVKKAVR